MYHISGHQPVQYFNRLPRICKSDVAYILDPVVATAATIMSVVAILKKVCLCGIFIFCVVVVFGKQTAIFLRSLTSPIIFSLTLSGINIEKKKNV